MALASGLPLAGVTTCEAVAAAVSPAERDGLHRACPLLVCIDGKRADLFVQPFDADLIPLAEPDAVMPEDLARRYPGPLLLVGDGAARLAAAMPWARLSTAPAFADARIVARLALRRHEENRALPAQPLYLRPPDVTLAGTR
jgi:tRNA threonylcarbamoyladenosine biosynthesis protein TsaB